MLYCKVFLIPYSPSIAYMTTLPEKRYRKIYIFYNIRLDDICRWCLNRFCF